MMTDELHSGTVEGLLRFLEYSAEKGLLNPRTAGARKSACTKILEIDGSAWRTRNIDDIDIDDQVARFQRKIGGKLSPGSMTTYQQRFRDALADYAAFLVNPSGYRGTAPRPRPKKSSLATSTPTKQGPTVQAEPAVAPLPTTGLVTYPFPLSDGTLGYVQLPRDVTIDDTERLCAFIRSLAVGVPSPRGSE
jgi:hypothetical protein